MNDLNSVIIEGNLTQDPESTVTKGWTTLCTFPVAVNRYYKKEGERFEEVSFFEVETWGRIAENCYEYLSKGRGVRVVGRLKQSRWEAEDGSNRSKIVIVAEHVEFKPMKRAHSNSEREGQYV